MPRPRSDMNRRSIAIVSDGLVTSVGMGHWSCAAIRAGVANPTETQYMASGEDWIIAHQVELEKPWKGNVKLVKMLAEAVRECLIPVGAADAAAMPVLLCVAEIIRRGRAHILENQLLRQLEQDDSARTSEELLQPKYAVT